MVKASLAGFVLVEVRADGTQKMVSEHPDFGSGWSAGQAAVHADGNEQKAFSLYVGNPGRRVARFAHNRIIAKNPVMNFEGMVIAL